MKAFPRLRPIRPLIRDTFRQARASRVGAMMLGVTAVCTLLCLSVGVSGDKDLHGGDEPPLFLPAPSARAGGPLAAVTPEVRALLETDPASARREGVDTVGGQLTLGFGAVAVPIGRERRDAVHFLELVLAGGVAGTCGVLLTLVWTAGFVPTFLEPGAASVLLAKPVARWQLLAAKYVGVLVFVGVQAALFITLTWLALGARTGVWDRTYLWSVPLLLLQFAVFYAFSVLLGVVTRSTVACVFGAVLFWLLGWGINYGWAMTRKGPEPLRVSPLTRASAAAAYWAFPKPIDSALILFNTLDARSHFEKPEVFTRIESGGFSPRLSILSSLVAAGALLALSAYELETADY